MNPNQTKEKLRNILTPELLISVYNLKFPYAKGRPPSAVEVEEITWGENREALQSFYDLVFHPALEPSSKLPLQSILQADLTELLPDSGASDYPEQSLGLILILDQARALNAGYGKRYTRSFFDPICEKLARQFIAQADPERPDGKLAWTSRGYSFEDWLIRVLWFWAPLVHSDEFMTQDRQTVKDWLHYMRAEVETHSGLRDPFANLEGSDDTDLTLFGNLLKEGPPTKSYTDPEHEATLIDYTFWWIRILNSHFAITDMCGHYPYWVRWKGEELSKKDNEFFRITDGFRYVPEDEELLSEIRSDFLKGVWKPLPPNDGLEKSAVTANLQALRPKMLGERGHGPVVTPRNTMRPAT